jgi:hypothetical protein
LCIGVGVSRGLGSRLVRELSGLGGMRGVVVGVLVGDSGEQLGLVGEQRGAFGGFGVARAVSGEAVDELGDLGCGDRLGAGFGLRVSHGGLRVG